MNHQQTHSGPLQHLRVGSDATKKKKVFRCLICPGCDSSESKQPTFWTRDLNSALNIRQLALKWMNERTRPAAFCRAAGLTRTSPTGEEKTGQVDIRTRRASEPAKKKAGVDNQSLLILLDVNKLIPSKYDRYHLPDR